MSRTNLTHATRAQLLHKQNQIYPLPEKLISSWGQEIRRKGGGEVRERKEGRAYRYMLVPIDLIDTHGLGQILITDKFR